VKQLEIFFRTLYLLFAGTFLLHVSTASAQSVPDPMDSVQIGLITCSPHDEVYSLYGHTAIHFVDQRHQTDLVFNYGIFNFKKPHFVLRFVFGLTDYELGVYPFDLFCNEYTKWKCQVTEQVLNLTSEEKARLAYALYLNAQPENRVYRYNIFYDNCSSRARDIIEQQLDGTVVYQQQAEEKEKTYRELVHEHTGDNRWAAFGNDLLLGIKSDIKISRRAQQFLPAYLYADFRTAVVDRHGEKQSLVKKEIVWNQLGDQPVSKGFPLPPLTCFLILCFVSVILFIYEQRRKTCLRWFDGLLMLTTGLAGCILFVMIFSEHPTTSINLQILILNPLSLFFIPGVLKGRKSRWFTISLIMTVLFFVGALWQDYAEGMEILALCLLLRYWRHHNDK